MGRGRTFWGAVGSGCPRPFGRRVPGTCAGKHTAVTTSIAVTFDAEFPGVARIAEEISLVLITASSLEHLVTLP